jgi:tetratricopeptide (TPR) repeat protein
MTSANGETLGKVLQLWDKGELDKAMDLLKREMMDHPDDPRCIGMAAHIYEKSGNLPVAYNLFKLAKIEEANEASHWLNYGRCAQDLWKASDAERAYNRAMTTTNRQSTKVFALGNLAAMHIDFGRFTKAEEYINKALKLDPEYAGALANLGFVQLARGDWENGWKNYRNTLGSDWRKRVQYGDEPEWDGSEGQAVAFYGEQGIGDEICFASLIDDLSRHCRKAIIECDYRLENLYKRSFPQATIYGTRHKKRPWAKEDQAMDASFPIGQACEFFRKSPHDCPQDPYLIADPERVAMWKSLWAQKG